MLQDELECLYIMTMAHINQNFDIVYFNVSPEFHVSSKTDKSYYIGKNIITIREDNETTISSTLQFSLDLTNFPEYEKSLQIILFFLPYLGFIRISRKINLNKDIVKISTIGRSVSVEIGLRNIHLELNSENRPYTAIADVYTASEAVECIKEFLKLG